MGSSGPRRRKPPSPLPSLPRGLRYPKGRIWRLGGPVTTAREAQALAAQRSRPPGRIGRWVLGRLGYRPGERS